MYSYQTVKYLIAGLGNPGPEYMHTRHNIGFEVVDSLARKLEISFSSVKKAWIAEGRYRSRNIVLLKPSTYMNLSGEAVRYWLNEMKIPVENLLVISDELALPFGTLRMRPGGNPAGHNGLISIMECLNTADFARLRFGIGSNFPRGRQSDYVLGHWSSDEVKALPELISKSEEMVTTFATQGIQKAMNAYNNK